MSLTQEVTVSETDAFATGQSDVWLRSSSATAGRIAAFDFVKGALVLLMVLYHWLNYYIGTHWGGYRYIRFLTPSFIFISGFLVSYVSLGAYAVDHARFRRRLFSRGAKLLIMFVALNVLAGVTIGERLDLRDSDPSTVLATIYAVFFSGDGRAAFDILVSIAYFLMLVPVVVAVARRLQLPLVAIACAVLAGVVIWGFVAHANPHVEMLAIGLLGLAAGERKASVFDAGRHRPMILMLAYLLYLWAVTRWNVIFPLQVVGVFLSLLTIYSAGDAWGTHRRIPHEIVLLGQYSLLSYVVQIAVLRFLRVALRPFDAAGAAVALPLIVTVVATLAIIETADRLRRRSRAFDRLYRTAFA